MKKPLCGSSVKPLHVSSVEITPEQFGAFEKHMLASGVEDITYVGTVSNGSRFIVQNGEEELINVSVAELQKAWKGE